MGTRTSLILGPRTVVNNIQKFIGATPQCAEVKRHAPGSLPVSTQNKDLQGQPLILSLSQYFVSCSAVNTLPPIIFTINGINYPVPARGYIIKVRGQYRGWVLKLELAGTLGLLLGGGCPLEAISHHCICC